MKMTLYIPESDYKTLFLRSITRNTGGERKIIPAHLNGDYCFESPYVIIGKKLESSEFHDLRNYKPIKICEQPKASIKSVSNIFTLIRLNNFILANHYFYLPASSRINSRDRKLRNISNIKYQLPKILLK